MNSIKVAERKASEQVVKHYQGEREKNKKVKGTSFCGKNEGEKERARSGNE